MAVTTFPIKIDWNKNGTFTSAYEDITSDVQTIHISYGRDDDMARAQPAEVRVTVSDPDGRYIPGNTSSPIVAVYGNILPGCDVQITAVLSGDTYHLFNGQLDDVIPEPDKSVRKATLPCVDGLDYLVRTPISTAMRENAYAGGNSGLVHLILDKAGWPAAKRVVATRELDQYPAWFVEQEEALNALQNFEKSEGAFGYVGCSGDYCWEDRYTRLLDTRCTSSQWTCTKNKHTKVEPLYSLKSVINEVVVKTQPRTKQDISSIIWTLTDNSGNGNSPHIYPNQTKEYLAEFALSGGKANIAGDVLTVRSGDYYGNATADGTGADRTVGISVSTQIFAASAKIQVKNLSSDCYLTQLQIRGKMYVDDAPLRIEVTDASSQLAYRRNTLDIDLPYYINATMAQSWGQYQIATKKEPLPRYKVTLQNKNIEIWQQMLARKISDRIGLQNSDYNISGEFYIDHITHDIECGKWHQTEWIVSRADNQQYWVWDRSRWGIDTRWGY